MIDRFMAHACAGLLGLFVGCASDLRDPERFAADGSAVAAPASAEAPGTPAAPSGEPACLAPLLAARCASNGCHDDKGSAAHLDLASPGVSARLLGVDAASTGPCAGKGKLIDPAAPAQSLVYTHVLTPPSCGTPMPPGSALAPAEVDCFKQWVESVKP
jgi:hypothetical protein